MIEKVFTTQEYKIKALIEGDSSFDIKGSWALISIYHNPKNPVIRNEEDIGVLRSKGCRKSMSVCFGDYTDREYQRFIGKYKNAFSRIKLITKVQARSIVSFIKGLQKYDSIKTLVVQCKAGQSRSGAVGLYACRLYGLDEDEYRKSGNILPNYFVYGMLSEVYNPLFNPPLPAEI